MPAPREALLGDQLLDLHVEEQTLVVRVQDLGADARAGVERAARADAEPLAELGGVGERLPHARPGSLDEHLPLDAIARRCHATSRLHIAM